MQVLSTCLRTNASLKALVLDHNPLGDGGAAALSSEMRWNMGVSSLSLQYCNIGEGGCAALAQNMLGSPQSKLTTLNLQGLFPRNRSFRNHA